jgi:hypothetical protein
MDPGAKTSVGAKTGGREGGRKRLPIPLTCHPEIVDGKCVHGLDNGACELPTEFM